METSVTRRAFLAVTGTAALAGCALYSSADGEDGGASPSTASPTSGDRSTSGDAPASGDASTPGDGSTSRPPSTSTDTRPGTTTTDDGSLPPVTDRSLPLPRPPSEVSDAAVSGGVHRDGIPSIDEPTFESADKADGRLDSNAIVFGAARDGTAKAYPQRILSHHEICNDSIDGQPISITYCPLTGTVLGFDRGDTTFGVSGRLVNSNLIMYDRATELWWPQVLATSVHSPWHDGYTRHTLREIRVIWTTWERWRNLYPGTRVLTRDTGYVRNYDKSQYGQYDYPRKSGYFAPTSPPAYPSLHESDRYVPKQVVMGARTPDGAVAFLKDALRDQKLMTGKLAESPVLAVYDAWLDTGYVYHNPDGASFSYRDGEIIGGDDSSHAPDALPLSRIHTFDAMWFAWYGFYPDTSVYGA